MAGHSKWANIKHRKAAQDAKRGKAFTKLIRELVVAARQGGPEPADNPRLRAAVDKKLTSKGYRQVEEGGDFQIDYQFKASIAEGALNMTATDANNQDIPVSSQDLLINRRADQALVDNAYALAGPKEVTSILLRFSDGASQNLVWAAGMSKVVDHANFDAKRMQSGVDAAVSRALGRLPNAN